MGAVAQVLPLLALMGVGVAASVVQMLLGEWLGKQQSEEAMRQMIELYVRLMPLFMIMQLMQLMPAMLMVRWY